MYSVKFNKSSQIDKLIPKFKKFLNDHTMVFNELDKSGASNEHKIESIVQLINMSGFECIYHCDVEESFVEIAILTLPTIVPMDLDQEGIKVTVMVHRGMDGDDCGTMLWMALNFLLIHTRI